MYVSRIVIKNFRNIRYFDVPLQDGVTTIIGENNTGKTNLLHAIRMVLDADLPAYMRQLTQSDINEAVCDEHPIQVLISLEFRDFERDVEASAFAAFLKVEEDMARITYRFRPNAEARDNLESGELEPDDLSLEDYRWEISGGGETDPADLTWNDEAGQSVRYSDLADYLVVFLHALRDASSDFKSRSSPLRRLLRSLDIPVDEQERLVEVLQKANEEITEAETIQEIGGLLKERFTATAGEAFGLDVKLGMASPNFAAIERTLTVLLTSPTHTSFEASENGLGLNNVLYVAILLQYFETRIESRSIAGGLLLVEEPEAHLHPQLERVIYQTLNDHAVQAFVTTHSSHIASSGSIDDAVILTTTDDGSTRGHVPRTNELMTDANRADVSRYLDATKSTLLFSRRVILVEGPAELFLLQPLVKAVKELDLDRHGVAVVPVYGTHFESYIKLFGPGGIPKRCAVITDRDGEEGDEPPRGLGEYENDYVKVFSTATTFEHSLAIEGMLEPLRRAATELRARRLTQAIEGGDLDLVAERALAAANQHSKGRFAQVLSRYTEHATEIPDYLSEAVDWVCE